MPNWGVVRRVSRPGWHWEFLLVHLPHEGIDLAGLNRPLARTRGPILSFLKTLGLTCPAVACTDGILQGMTRT